MSNYTIFLDDERKCPEGYVHCKSYDEFVDTITNRGLPWAIHFDHDLGYLEKTGADCARRLIKYCTDNNKKLPICGVHSHNPDGAANIKSLLRSFVKSQLEEHDAN